MWQDLLTIVTWLIDVVFSLLLLLFGLRLYATNPKIARAVNKWYDLMVGMVKLIKRSLLAKQWRMLPVICIVIGLLWIVGWLPEILFSFWLIILGLFVLPLVLVMMEQSQMDSLDKTINHLKADDFSKAQAGRLKDALADYYNRANQPKEKSTKDSLLLKAFTFPFLLLYVLLHPKIWGRFILPTVTTWPLVREFFRYHPYHARFAQYHHLMDLVKETAKSTHIRLFLSQINLSEGMMVAWFHPTGKRGRERLRLLVDRLKALDPESFAQAYAQVDNDKLKLVLLALPEV